MTRFVGLVVVVLSALGCRATQSGAINPKEEQSRLTDHVRVYWRGEIATEAEVEAVLARAEEAWARFVDLFGEERRPPAPVDIRLQGDAGPRDAPTVDPSSGAMLLFRFPGHGGAYEASVAHELFHVWTRHIWSKPEATSVQLFLHEGFAEVAASEARLPSLGFPTFGFPVPVAAERFLGAGEALPIEGLVSEHHRYNFPCMAQAYVLRLSFVSFLKERMGLEKLAELVFRPPPVSKAELEEAAGASLSELERQWRAWHSEELKKWGDAAERVAAYRQSPIRHFKVCPSK